MNKEGYLRSTTGGKSSTRLIALIVVIVALIFAQETLIFGYLQDASVMITASAAGTIFTTVAGSVMVWTFNQKKNEIQQSANAQTGTPSE